jgi:outer membrane protein OmpA-like peptidoglycan-associated protein
MSNGAGASATLTLPAGGTGTGTLAAPTTHVCELPKPLLFPTARSFIPATADNKAAFQDLFTRLKLGGSLDHLLITGHTDSLGDAGTNQALSVRRTQSVQAVLQDDTAAWDTLSSAEGWGATEVNAMVAEADPPPTPRADLVRRYFGKLLGGAAVPPIQATAPPQLGCGQSQLLHGSRSAPSRDATQPPIEGEFQPNRRVEFFFFDNSGAPISCSEYPRWTLICSLTPPPPPTITVTLSPLTSVGVNKNVDVQVTINPSPLPAGNSITLTLSTTLGAGSAIFTSSSGATATVTATGPVTIRGVAGSSVLNNIHIAATQTGKVAVLAQGDFTVQDAISIFVKFEVWDTSTLAFVPLPPGVDVDIVDFNILKNTKLTSGQTDALGQVLFNQASLGQAKPDIFFLVHTNSRAHAHTTLPPQWSTKGWKATDGNPGFIPNYDGTPIGTPPASPRVFRVGLDFHARFTYLNPGRDTSPPRPRDDPAPKSVPVNAQSGSLGPGPPSKTTLPTDDNGEVHGLLFNVDPGDDFSFVVNFEMTDASINLPRAMVNDPLAWATLAPDADKKLFANNDRTSIGTQTSPEIFRATVEERAHSFFMLKVLREWSTFWFAITGGAWTGVNGLLLFNTVIPPATASFSFPVGQVHIHPDQHFERDTVAHELTHQVMWKEADFGSLAIAYEGTLGNLQLFHEVDLLSNGEHALIEGWAETIEAVFSTLGTPPYSVATVHSNGFKGLPLGPPPPGQGESVEGAFANALWAIFQNHVVTLPTNGHVPNTPNGNIMGTSAGAYLRDLAVRDRFLSMIFRPLQDLKPINRPATTDMIAKIKSRNAAQWPKLHPEFQAFNLAMDTPTIASVSPSGGNPVGGNTVTIKGSEFTFNTTTVTIGPNSAVLVAVTDDGILTAKVPAGTLGPADVVVTTPGGSAKLTGGYLYTPAPVVRSVSPNRGDTNGRIPVTINGSNFLPGATITFGGLAAESVVLIPPTEIQAKTPVFVQPANKPGGVKVVVTNPDTQAGELDPAFDYLLAPAPSILSFAPTSGPALTAILITGANFVKEDVKVLIGGIDTNVDRQATTTTQIRTQVPDIPLPPPPQLDVQAVNPDGQSHFAAIPFVLTQ